MGGRWHVGVRSGWGRRKSLRDNHDNTRKLRAERLEDRRLLAVLYVNTHEDNYGDDDKLSLREALFIAGHGQNDINSIQFPGDPLPRFLSPSEKLQVHGDLADARETIHLDIVGETIELEEGVLTLASTDLEIIGPGSDSVIIDAGSNSQIFYIPSATYLRVSGLTLRNGFASTDGGAIFGGATHTELYDVAFVGNTSSANGGALAVNTSGAGSSLNITNCSFEGNVASGYGGALFLGSYGYGQVVISNSRIVMNSAGSATSIGDGGGIAVLTGYGENGGWSGFGNFTIEDCVITQNKATGNGGGIYAWLHGGEYGLDAGQNVEFTFSRLSVVDNESGYSGGGIYIESNHGFEPEAATFDVLIHDSTVFNNKAYGGGESDPVNIGFGGGGIAIARGEEDFSFNLINSTISSNKAESGGGLLLDGGVDISHCTVVRNEAGRFAEMIDLDPGPDKLEPTGGGGVLIRNANPDHRAGGPRSIATFSHTIVARNLHSTSPNIAIHYANGGFPSEIPVPYYYDQGGMQVYLDEICLVDPPIDMNFDAAYWNDLYLKYYTNLTFYYSIIDSQSGPLAPCGSVPDEDEGALMAFSQESVVIRVDPLSDFEINDRLIAPLGDNGGYKLPDGSTILTHALPCNSEAVNAGDGVDFSNLPYDERGAQHPRVYGPAIDIGAFEFGPADVPSLAADFDGDYDVDSMDLQRWRSNAGKSIATKADGDADGDGNVDGQDLEIWRLQFGTNVPPEGMDADFNGDDAIDGPDFIIWLSNVGKSAAIQSEGDADGDGDVDGEDLFIWQREYGNSIDPACASLINNVHIMDEILLAAEGGGVGGPIVVSNLADENDGNFSPGDLSLREAIYIAGQKAGADEIIFAKQVRGLIRVSSELVIGSDLTITGPGHTLLTIDASAGDPNQATLGDGVRAFNIMSGGTVAISGLTITGGDIAGNGGGVSNEGQLTLSEVSIRDNYAGWYGGGIYLHSTGVLYVDSSTIDNNEAGVSGGGVLSLVKDGTSLVFKSSTISNNVAQYSGGLHIQGVAYTTSGRSWIINCTFSGNSALTSGGIGVQNSPNTKTQTNIVNSTITQNVATGTSPGGAAGGVHNINVTNTYDQNTQIGDSITLQNTILVANVSEYTAFDEGKGGLGGSSSQYSKHNVIGTSYSGLGISHGSDGNRVGVSGVVDTQLAENGGLTKTHALLPGSVAIDAGDILSAINYGAAQADQRGLLRYGDIDVGAVERGLVVSTAADENDGNHTHGSLSLREALGLAASAGGKQITFDSSVWEQTISLSSAFTHLPINSDVEIIGPGVDQLTIKAYDPNPLTNNFDGSRAFQVASGVTASIQGLTITGGDVSGGGGGIFGYGHLKLDHVHVVDNATNANGGGVWISVGGSLIASRSTFDGNFSAGSGGGVGGQFSTGETLTILDCTFSNNVGSTGGGLKIQGAGAALIATIANTTFSGNSGTVSGGAINVQDSQSCKTHLIITNSTITNNRAMGSAPAGAAGGIFNVNLTNQELAGVIDGVTLYNTIVAGNMSDNTTFHDGWGNLNGVASKRSANNLIGLTYSSLGIQDGAERNVVGMTSPINARLGPLADNGGATKTHGLLWGSPAIDAGSNGYADEHSLDYDQRVELRIRDGNLDGLSVADIGAYEVDADEFFATVGA